MQSVCKSPIKQPAAPDQASKQMVSNADISSLDQLLQQTDDNSTDDLGLWTITGGVTQGYHVHLKINHKAVQMELDTGAAVLVMSKQQWKNLTNNEPVKPYQGKPLRA